MRIDLHAHTTASDGTDAPAALGAAARAAGLDVVAITDHDTVGGWTEAARTLPPGVTLVPGVEVSSTAGGVSMHLLGYLFDPGDDELANELGRTRDDRVPRAREMVTRLAGAGYAVTWEQVLTQCGSEATVGRPHIADALVANGVVPDRSAAFAGPLHNSSPHYVRHYAPEPRRIVELITRAGGVTVFAHPGAHRRGVTVDDDVIADLARAGITGLEVDHPDHEPATRNRLRGLAGELGLLVTGASDYHGRGKPQPLGAELTDPETYAELVARASGRTVVTA